MAKYAYAVRYRRPCPVCCGHRVRATSAWPCRDGWRRASHLRRWSSARLLDAGCLVNGCSLEGLSRTESVTSTKNSVDEFCGLLCQRSRGTYCGRCNGESIRQQGYAISWQYILMSGAFNSLSAQACKFRLRRQTFAAPATLTPRQVHPLLCSTKLLPITPIWL